MSEKKDRYVPSNSGGLSLVVGGWMIDPSELKRKGLVGRIMWDIAFCQADSCNDKQAYMELLEETAKEIIIRVKGEEDGS